MTGDSIEMVIFKIRLFKGILPDHTIDSDHQQAQFRKHTAKEKIQSLESNKTQDGLT